MPTCHTIDAEKGVIYTTTFGIVTDSDLIGSLTAIRLDARFRSDLRCLADYQGVDLIAASAGTLISLSTIQPFAAETRRAFVVKQGLVASMVNFYRINTLGQIKVFEDRREALAWLNEGVPPEKFIE